MNEKMLQMKMIKYLLETANENDIKVFFAYGSALGAVREKGFIPWDPDVDVVIKYDEYLTLLPLLRDKLPKEFTISCYQFDKKYDSMKARIHPSNMNHHDLHIDVFPIAGISNNTFFQKLQVKVSYIIYKMFYFKKVETFTVHKKSITKIIISLLLKTLLFLIPSGLLIKLHEFINNYYDIKSSLYLHNTCGSYGYKEVIKSTIYGKGQMKEFEGFSVLVPEKYDEYLRHFYGDYMVPKEQNFLM